MAVIGLHDSERESMRNKTFPNFAIMKIAAYHKKQGDVVEWWNRDKRYDKVYSSKCFDFTPTNPHLPPDTIKGGTGYGLLGKLPDKIDVCNPDYSLYPDCDYAVGFITRGCIRSCDFCVVPRKEGGIRPCGNWQMLVRGDSQKLVLMDNNILACDYGIRQLAELAQTDYRLDINQGMDVTLLTEDVVAILAKIKWIRFIRFSCDNEDKLPYFVRMAELFKKHGISLSRVFVYVLVRGDIAEADRRVQALCGIYRHFNLFAQAERNIGVVPSKAQLEFAGRYVFKGAYKKETWSQYCERTGFK